MNIASGLRASLSEKADGTGWDIRCRVFLKRRKARSERRRARLNPECVPGYGRYRGWLL